MDRRDFIKTTSVAAAATGARTLLSAPSTARQPDLIKSENAKPGATDWQLTRVRPDKAGGVRASAIEGYCSRQSLRAGETLDIMVSTAPAARFKIEIFRSGYYGGAGARLMATLGPFEGKTQPVPTMGEKRLMECKWAPCTSLKIPADWPSGVYLGRLTTLPNREPGTGNPEPYWQNYIVFIVKDDRPADILFQCSDNTWQAYNKWPENTSLYTDPRGAHARGVAASFDRPYGKYVQIFENPQTFGSGEWLCFEFPAAYWLEQQGYDVTYCSNSDCLDAAQIMRCKAMISIGHDEYWDVRQYHAVKAAIDQGVSVLWLTGNAVCSVTPFSENKRVIERTGHFSGMSNEEVEQARRVFTEDHQRTGPDETLIIGARTVIPFNGGGDWTCTKPEHWLFEGTGMKKGDSISGLVGWEHHGAPAKIPGLEVVAEGLVWAGGTTPSRYTATVFPGPKGNIVFNAATIWWAQGLGDPPGHMIPWSHWSRPHGPDERVQRITANALKRAIGG